MKGKNEKFIEISDSLREKEKREIEARQVVFAGEIRRKSAESLLHGAVGGFAYYGAFSPLKRLVFP